MTWLFYALLSPALFASGNCADKYVLEHRVKDYRGVPLYVTIITAGIAVTFWLLAGSPSPFTAFAGRLILSGICLMIGYLLYYHAMTLASVSYVGLVFQLIPVFMLGGAVIFLGETLRAVQILGFVLILGACTFASVEKGSVGLRIVPAFWYILGADALFAASSLVVKSVIGGIGLPTTVAFEATGVMLGGVLIALCSAQARQSFTVTMCASRWLTLLILGLNEGVYLAAKIVGFIAIAKGPIALVGALGGTQVFYLVIYEAFLGFTFPRFFSADLSRARLIRQTLLAGVVFLGIWIIR